MKPEKIKQGDNLRVIAPSNSLAIIGNREVANERFKDVGVSVSYSKNSEKQDEFISSSIKERIEDIHNAFKDKDIQIILSAIGGYNSNELLPYIDWNLIKENPKIFGGFSDITILLNAIYAKTGLITYHAPHYSSFTEKQGFDYTWEYFKKCLFFEEEFEIHNSETWSNDVWWMDQEKRNFLKNKGRYTINHGEAEGTILGGHLGTFALLFGTDYLPSLKNSILFLESDSESNENEIFRLLESLTQQKYFEEVKGILFGRFEKDTVSKEKLIKFINKNEKLKKIPIIADLDFGHTEPFFTFPIGGKAKMIASKDSSKIIIKEH